MKKKKRVCYCDPKTKKARSQIKAFFKELKSGEYDICKNEKLSQKTTI